MVSVKQTFLSALTIASVARAMIPIEVDGLRFIKPDTDYTKPGEVFFLKGVDYQPGGSSGYSDSEKSDVLTDAEACYRDAYALQQLGVNTIRIYTVDPDLNHDECMSIFNAAGFYVIFDVNSPLGGQSLNRYDPSSTYNSYYLTRVFKMIDAFKNYPNVLGFFSGNEIINDGESAGVSPKYIRAVQRDMKQYIANNANRTIPVGYSAADVTELRAATWEYLQCNINGTDSDESKSDFFGLNSYEWCSGVSDWSTSGYSSVNSTFANSSIPVFFSEYGCNTDSPRTFDEVSGGIYDGLIDTLSGGLVYEYSEESSDYGLVEIDSDGSIEYLDDFNNLKKQFNKVSIPSISENDVSAETITKCNAKNIEASYSDFDADFNIPDTPSDCIDMILYGVNNSNIGEIVDIDVRASNYSVMDSDGNTITSAIFTVVSTNTVNVQSNIPTTSASKASSSSSAHSTSAVSTASSSSSKAEAAGLGYNCATGGVAAALAFLITALL